MKTYLKNIENLGNRETHKVELEKLETNDKHGRSASDIIQRCVSDGWGFTDGVFMSDKRITLGKWLTYERDRYARYLTNTPYKLKVTFRKVAKPDKLLSINKLKSNKKITTLLYNEIINRFSPKGDYSYMFYEWDNKVEIDDLTFYTIGDLLCREAATGSRSCKRSYYKINEVDV